jgi:mono/diheme cytochrome c family protein
MGGACRHRPSPRVAVSSMRSPLVVAVVLASAVAYAEDKVAPDLGSPEVVDAGRKLYLDKRCSHCHGPTGNGAVKLTNRDLSNPKLIFDAIAEGRQKGAMRMPALGDVLSKEEIWQATAYVMSLSHVAK